MKSGKMKEAEAVLENPNGIRARQVVWILLVQLWVMSLLPLALVYLFLFSSHEKGRVDRERIEEGIRERKKIGSQQWDRTNHQGLKVHDAHRNGF